MSRVVEQRAAAAAARQAGRIAALMAAAMPDARVARDGGEVRVEARGAIGRAGWVRGMIA